MSDELLVNRVWSSTTHVPGRSLNSARSNHFVIDEPAYAGGPGEALTPADAFLAGVSACGVLLVQSFAHRDGIPLQHAEATIEGIRTRDNPADFQSVNVRFELVGPNAQQAQQLVDAYRAR